MKLKKILAVVSALCMMATVIPILPVQEIAVISANAEDAEYAESTYENLNYKKYADHIEISGVTDKKITEANIPAEIDGLPVTTIGGMSLNMNLISVTIPDSVINIEQNAFLHCIGLISVIIPDSVTNIGQDAFGDCTSLTSITIENPDCIIYDSSTTICSGKPYSSSVGLFNGIIYGYEGSTAQAYAEKYSLTFESIGSASETESQSGEMVLGDADSNQKIDILDVITLNKAVMGKETLSENSLKAIDFNHNGKPDSEEALTLLKYIVGLIPDFIE